ncbi:hypothetical protein AX16_001191 [Volvariella volvacea WC 439]|nr:hypothetical protein AX16_001191 [Volvariella volvacea WC 439]
MSSSTEGHARTDTESTLTSPGLSPDASGSKLITALHPAGSPSVPPTHPYRTLILCFDGTGDQFDADNSNIVQLFSMLKKDNRSLQMVYYQAGIGTYTSPQFATPLASKVSKSLDEAVAWNLDEHVMEGYKFLMQNYIAGDRICIFGFSRGAYTARSLAGMIHKVGLLPPDNWQQVPFAYKMYTREDEVGWQQSNAFKQAFSIDVDIEFIGVWDTVNSVGLIPRRLPFTTSNTIVRTFRHAVSLDERRAKFKANLWNRPNVREQTLSVTDQKKAQEKSKRPKLKSKEASLRNLERRYGDKSDVPTDIEEVWFAGCHCDVGGGSVPNETKHSLARIPLRWMIRECFKTNTGILFDPEGLRRIGLDPDSLYPIVQPRPAPLSLTSTSFIQRIPTTPAVDPVRTLELDLKNFSDADSYKGVVDQEQLTEEQHDLLDGLSPVYDQLSLAPGWWVLEMWPIKQRYQRGDDSWTTYYGMNMGQGRIIPKQKKWGVKVHRSVKVRMEASYENGEKYVPKASLNLDCVTWVD